MRVLADSSAWVELLRRTGSPLDLAIRRRLKAGDVATTDIVMMEVLAGSTPAARIAGVQLALDACAYLPQHRRSDAIAAAELYRRCRKAGETPRQLTDCLIAAIALRNQVSVLQRDRDFDVLARHTELKVTTE